MNRIGRINNVSVQKTGENGSQVVFVEARFSPRFPSQELERPISGGGFEEAISQATIDVAISQKACLPSTKVAGIKIEGKKAIVVISSKINGSLVRSEGESSDSDIHYAVADATKEAILDME